MAARARRRGEAWAATRFAGPHLRDDLLDRGVMVETLETATTWTQPRRAARGRAGGAAAALGTPLVGCHVSHLYPTGASLYFTVLGAPGPHDPVAPVAARPRPRRRDAIVAAGGTITHHHAIGADHAPWLGAEIGALGVDVLRAVKERCDPAGIMNPGKLLGAKPGSLLPSGGL